MQVMKQSSVSIQLYEDMGLLMLSIKVIEKVNHTTHDQYSDSVITRNYGVVSN